MMLDRLSLAQWFLIGGVTLAILGCIVWIALPIRSTFPPFLTTALLAVGYGLICLVRGRSSGKGKR